MRRSFKMDTRVTYNKKIIFWLGLLAALFVVLALFRAVLLPFVLGGLIAYLLRPAVEALGRVGISRRHAAFVLVFVFAAGVVIAFMALLPIVMREAAQFAREVPLYIQRLHDLIYPLIQDALRMIGQNDPAALKADLMSNSAPAVNFAGNVASGILIGGQNIAAAVYVITITPVAAYFMIKDWDSMTAWIKGLIPPSKTEVVMKLWREIDRKIAGFIRGQLLVMFSLGAAYAIALSVAGLDYGFLIGIVAGLLSIIPMVGSVVGLLAGVLMAWFQTGEWSFVALIAGIFIAGQLIEGNFLTPKIIGDRVGLHPLWVFFAIMAGASLFGIPGMIVAVPVAAIISVLLAYGIYLYKKGPFYNSRRKDSDDDARPPDTF